MEKEITDNLLDELKEKHIQKAVDAGFTREQAEYLSEKFQVSSLGFGGIFG